MSKHCRRSHTIEPDNILGYYINLLDGTPYKDQRQMPNPTVIETVGSYVNEQLPYIYRPRTVVFTAYLREV